MKCLDCNKKSKGSRCRECHLNKKRAQVVIFFCTCKKKVKQSLSHFNKNKNHFCSVRCRARRGWVSVKCDYCQKIFKKSVHRFKKTPRSFCNRKHFYLWRKGRGKGYGYRVIGSKLEHRMVMELILGR